MSDTRRHNNRWDRRPACLSHLAPWHGLPAHGDGRTNCIRGSRPAFALVIVLVAIAAVTLILITLQSTALRHAAAGREAVARTRAHWAARAGLESAIARFAYNIENPDPGSAFTVYDDMAELFVGQLDDASWQVLYDDGLYEREGPADAHAKLNVNRMTRDDLLELTSMTEDVADAILDWIDEDDTPGEFGAEAGSYASRNPPIVPRNGPVRTIQELELVRGVRAEYLRGEDWNLNGRLDPNEDDGETSFPPDNADGVLDAGWSDHITAQSVDFGLAFSGRERIDLTTATADQLTARLGFLTTPQSEAILAHARNNDASVWDYLTTPLSQIAAANETIPNNIPDLTLEQIEQLIDEVSMTSPDDGPIPGRLNINTVDRETLEKLTSIDPVTRDILILERNARGGAGFASNFELLEIPGITPQSLAVLSQFIDTRPNAFVITSTGRDENTGIEAQIVATINRTALPVPITEFIAR